MGTFSVDTESQPGMLRFKLEGVFSVDDAHKFVAAHNAGVDRFRDAKYVVFGDMRALRPLSPEAAEIVEQAKRYSAGKRNFRGSAILIGDAMVALQHRRTSITSGVMATELISANEDECRKHLQALLDRADPRR